jgi:hypothetical protein
MTEKDRAMLNTFSFRLAISLPILLVLAACGSTDPSLPEARCRAAGAEAELGKTVNEKVADDARYAAGAMRVRVIRPGQAVTMDADPQRLNIEVDETGRIRRLRCG